MVSQNDKDCLYQALVHEMDTKMKQRWNIGIYWYYFTDFMLHCISSVKDYYVNMLQSWIQIIFFIHVLFFFTVAIAVVT